MTANLELTAQIVRQLAEIKAGIPACKIQLMGAIEPTFTLDQNGGHSWWSGASHNTDTLFGFNPETGFVLLDDMKGNYAYSDNGTPYSEEGETLTEYLERKGGNYLFYLLHKEGKEYGENGDYYDTWYLYKGFNLAEHLSALNTADVARWEAWIVE